MRVWARPTDTCSSGAGRAREWLEFLACAQGAEPVVARVVEPCEDEAGFFVGAMVRRFGVRILGSPSPGWTTG
jgi:hypothetical protein